MNERARTSTRMVEGFRRLRRSKHFGIIHGLIASGVPAREVARRIQTEWGEMKSISNETLTRQLQRYRATLQRGGGPIATSPSTKQGGGGMPTKENNAGAWALGGGSDNEGGGNSGGGDGSDDGGDAKGGGSSPAHTSTPESEALNATMEEGKAMLNGGGKGTPPHAAIEGEGGEPIGEEILDVHGGLVSLLQLQMGRIAMEVDNEITIGKLMPGTGLEINVAKEILKGIHVVQGDLGLRHQEPSKNIHAIGVGELSPKQMEGMAKSGILAVISDQKSRKRLLKRLSGATSLESATNNGSLSKNGQEGPDGEGSGEAVQAEVVEKTEKTGG